MAAKLKIKPKRPKKQPKPQITQDLLSMFFAAKKAASEYEGLRKIILDLHNQGCKAEPGLFVMKVADEQQVRPKWKECFINACGEEAAKVVIDSTEPINIQKLTVLKDEAKL